MSHDFILFDDYFHIRILIHALLRSIKQNEKNN